MAAAQSAEMICRSSDYRTVASDPDFDVIEVHADFSEIGYHMIMAVTAEPKHASSYNFDKITSVYVLSGWECYVRVEVEY